MEPVPGAFELEALGFWLNELSHFNWDSGLSFSADFTSDKPSTAEQNRYSRYEVAFNMQVPTLDGLAEAWALPSSLKGLKLIAERRFPYISLYIDKPKWVQSKDDFTFRIAARLNSEDHATAFIAKRTLSRSGPLLHRQEHGIRIPYRWSELMRDSRQGHVGIPTPDLDYLHIRAVCLQDRHKKLYLKGKQTFGVSFDVIRWLHPDMQAATQYQVSAEVNTEITNFRPGCCAPLTDLSPLQNLMTILSSLPSVRSVVTSKLEDSFRLWEGTNQLRS